MIRRATPADLPRMADCAAKFYASSRHLRDFDIGPTVLNFRQVKWNMRIPKFLRQGGRHFGKIRYGSMESASRACVQMAEKGRDGLTPYLCGFCLGFHIGHTPSLLLKIERIKNQ